MAEYIKLSEQEKAVLTKQEEEKQYWFDWLKRFSATKDYSVKEQAVDNFLRGYGEAVQYMLSVNEQLLLKAADVVEVVHRECPVCGGKKVIKQDCDNGYYVEVDVEQQEMSVWLGDECLAVFSIDFCPKCGAKMDGERKETND